MILDPSPIAIAKPESTAMDRTVQKQLERLKNSLRWFRRRGVLVKVVPKKTGYNITFSSEGK